MQNISNTEQSKAAST